MTRRFAAGWAAQSDSYRGKRSWVSSALGAHGWSCCLQLNRRGDLAVRWRRPPDHAEAGARYRAEGDLLDVDEATAGDCDPGAAARGGLALGDTDDSTDAAAVAGDVIVYLSFLVTGDGPEAVTTRRFTVCGPWAGTLTLISPDDTTRTAFQPGCRTSPSAVNPAPRTVTHAPGAPTPGITDTTSGERPRHSPR